MCQFFRTRGYPDPVIRNSKHRAQLAHPQSAPLSSHNKLEGRIPLTLTFHPRNISFKNIISKNFKLLQDDPTNAEIFAQPLLISYKRNKNLSNFLVKNALNFDDKPGTFKCARVRCRTCPFICNGNKIPGPISRGADWVIVFVNTLGMLRLTIKTLQHSKPVARHFTHCALCPFSPSG